MEKPNKGKLIYRSKYLDEKFTRDFSRCTGAYLFVIIALFLIINGFINGKYYAQLCLNVALFFIAIVFISILILSSPNRILIYENGFSTNLKFFHVISKEEEYFPWSKIEWMAYKKIKQMRKYTNKKTTTTSIALKGKGKRIFITISLYSRNKLLLLLRRKNIPTYLVKYISPRRVHEDPAFPWNVSE